MAAQNDWFAILSIMMGIFTTVTTEILPIGLLTSIGGSFAVSDGTAGLMMTTPGFLAAVAARSSPSPPDPGPHRTCHYRPDGALVGLDDMMTGSRRFDLDGAGRVTAVHGHNWSEHYAYDPAGNPIAANWPEAQRSAPEARGSREYGGTLIRRAGNVIYRHDPQGGMVERRQRTLSGQQRVWTYSRNADDRLIGLSTPDGTRWSYLYDPLGRRIGKQLWTPPALCSSPRCSSGTA